MSSRSRSRKLSTKNRRNSSKTLKRNTSKTLKRNTRKTLKRNTRKSLKRNVRKTKRSRRVNRRRNMRGVMKWILNSLFGDSKKSHPTEVIPRVDKSSRAIGHQRDNTGKKNSAPTWEKALSALYQEEEREAREKEAR